MKTTSKQRIILITLSFLLLTFVVLSAGNGALHISPIQVISIILHKVGISDIAAFDEGQYNVFWIIRFPRVMLGLLIGAGLALSGAALQGLFRNPLADPGLIGISAGASLSAVLVIVFLSMLSSTPYFALVEGMVGYYTLNIVTFIGSCITSFIVFSASRTNGKTNVTTMLLGGIAINALCGAMIGLITYYATDAELRNITFWTLGSLGGASWNTVFTVLPFILIPVVMLPRLSKALNTLALGEKEASYLGVSVDKLKIQIIIFSTMAVGSAVAVAGIISFVGLVVPHVLRMMGGHNQRYILIGSSLAGALLLTGSDLLARVIVAPAELPIGVITALIGTPVFAWILLRHKKESQFI
ncbi:FecCD family ABC transporter permease [Cytophaga aurantiaca]|uniref:FecCD family ABC transporter permease n=1 Tax=Cytophaga aurantiaca TaxID=29530 RepID=UPI0003805CCF|nr:iron ABC transporter permease [Cytophaga aurantiaca]